MSAEDGASRALMLAEHLAGSRKLARDVQNALTASQQAKAASDQQVETLKVDLESVRAELNQTKQELSKQIQTCGIPSASLKPDPSLTDEGMFSVVLQCGQVIVGCGVESEGRCRVRN
jgi:uncharacterized protein YbjT (DUF2867 family)